VAGKTTRGGWVVLLVSAVLEACGGGSTNHPPVPAYALSMTTLNPGTLSAGSAATSKVMVTPENGYSGNVTLSCKVIADRSPPPTCALSVSRLPIGGSAPGTSTLTVSTSSSTPGGDYSISVIASDAAGQAPSNGPQTLALTLDPPKPAYALSMTALNPVTLSAGSAATSTVMVTPANGYSGSVTLSCKVLTGGAPPPTCSLSVNGLAIAGSGPGTSTLTVSTSTNTSGGDYAISVIASDTSGQAPSNGPQTLSLSVAAVIQRIVIIFQENRTPDNLFQDPVLVSRGADIASSGRDSLGHTIPLTPIDLGTAGSNPQNYDLGHSHSDFVAMYHGGKMDGANLVSCTPYLSCKAHPNPQFKYVNPSDVQSYFALAEQYTFADRMFQTNQGPSFPAHQFIISGTSAPTATSPLFSAENPANYDVTGCIGDPANTIAMINASGSENAQPAQYPCFEHPTVTDLLGSKAITWRYYTPSAGFMWTAPVAIEHICQARAVGGALTCTGPEWTGSVVFPQSKVLSDIANGQLAQVTWIIPDGYGSDYALANDGSGPSWVSSIVNAIGNSGYWANTAIIITWDDWGGWYDHVPPIVINDGTSWGSGYVYGFRVPMIVVSPYAKAAYISHVTHDFGSILKFIEKTFGLRSLGYADTPADDLSDCFDLTQVPLSFRTIAAPLNASHFIRDKRPPIDPDDD
jgi:phospholipase C